MADKIGPIAICNICETPFYPDDKSQIVCNQCSEASSNSSSPKFLCYECGTELSPTDSEPLRDSYGHLYCPDCYHATKLKVILPHKVKRVPIFYGGMSGETFYGIELEVDCGGKSVTKARKLLKMVNTGDELIYIKSDNSLGNGLEIVTHPATLNFHRTRMPWKTITRTLAEMKYHSNDTFTCGLHVNMNKSSFGVDEHSRLPNLLRFICIFERFWPELTVFSRREISSLDKWASRYGYANTPSELLRSIRSTDVRTKCVNLKKVSAIEVRIFKGTLNQQTLLASIELVDYIQKVALSNTFKSILDMPWRDFVLQIDKDDYPNLYTYLTQLQLYPCEPQTYSDT